MTFKEPILYKYSTKNQPMEWSIFVEGDSFFTREGLVGGKITESAKTVCTPKNIGKVNETSGEQQAILEAKAKHQKKKAEGYAETIEESGAQFFKPMLAQTFDANKIDFSLPTWVQPKLDGLRAINMNNQLTSRNGKFYVACPHLYQKDVVLDGELYNHDLKEDFNKIVSLCKKQKPTEEDFANSKEMVKMWLYDLPYHPGVFSERFVALEDWFFNLDPDFAENFELVPTFQVKTTKQIIEYHEDFLEAGFEGTIIRQDMGPYENKRSKQLLKYKDFIDEEFTILSVEEGVGIKANTAGFMVLQHDKNPEQTFKSNIKGNFDTLKKLWENKESLVGKTATVKYFNRTPKQEDGSGDVPRFPYVIKIDRESYE